MSEMVERVTDAVMGAFEHIPDKEYRRTIAGCWARAAIEAMREPTEAMWKANQPTWSLGRPMWEWWRTMIDEALK